MPVSNISGKNSFKFPEIEMDFIVPLKDITVPEKKQAKFECTITKDVSKVIWYRGSDIVSSDQKYDIIDDGKKHMLVINHCEFDDEGDYSIEILSKTSTAKLTVEGKSHFKLLHNMLGAGSSGTHFIRNIT